MYCGIKQFNTDPQAFQGLSLGGQFRRPQMIARLGHQIAGQMHPRRHRQQTVEQALCRLRGIGQHQHPVRPGQRVVIGRGAVFAKRTIGAQGQAIGQLGGIGGGQCQIHQYRAGTTGQQRGQGRTARTRVILGQFHQYRLMGDQHP